MCVLRNVLRTIMLKTIWKTWIANSILMYSRDVFLLLIIILRNWWILIMILTVATPTWNVFHNVILYYFSILLLISTVFVFFYCKLFYKYCWTPCKTRKRATISIIILCFYCNNISTICEFLTNPNSPKPILSVSKIHFLISL